MLWRRAVDRNARTWGDSAALTLATCLPASFLTNSLNILSFPWNKGLSEVDLKQTEGPQGPRVSNLWTRDADGDSLGLEMGRNGLRVLAVFVMSIALPAVAAGQRDSITITSVTATSATGAAVVTIAANGPLPAPTIGTVDGPPRIFMDFVGVRSKVPAVTRSADPRIIRVRVALNSTQPLITRVVIDLAAHVPHRIEQSAGRLLVVVGDAAPRSTPPPPPPVLTASRTTAPPPPVSVPRASESAIPPVPPLPEPVPTSPPPPYPTSLAPGDPTESRTPPAASPRTASKTTRSAPRTVASPPPPKEIDRYLGLVRGNLDRLRLQQPLLGLIGSAAELPLERLQMAGGELQRLSQELAAIEPPSALRTHHDLLVQSARLGVIATSLRMEALVSGDAPTLRNANSAASGAMLLFNRACEDLGCQ